MQDKSAPFKPWELASFAEADLKQVRLPTAEAIENIQRQAHQEGYEAGFAEGREAGYREGGQQASAEAERVSVLLGGIETALHQIEKTTSEELLNLALEVSRQMLRHALKVRPELLLPIVRSVMESLPQHSQHPHLHIHPEDAELVRQHLPTELTLGGWKVVEDPRIERGGCRVETAAATVDATLANRWRIVAAALGNDMSWLDEDAEG